MQCTAAFAKKHKHLLPPQLLIAAGAQTATGTTLKIS